MKTPIDSTEPSPTITPSTTSERAPMKQLSSMIAGSACSGSSTPPMPTPPERWHVLADLRAGADRRPGIDHGALVDIGAEIDEGRHQHHARRDIGGAAHHASRARRGSRRCGSGPRPSRRTWRAPCPTRRAWPGPPGIDAHVVEAERQQHRLLQPLVDAPGAVGCFSATRACAACRAGRAPPRPPRGPRPWSPDRSPRVVRTPLRWSLSMSRGWPGASAADMSRSPAGAVCRGAVSDVKRRDSRTPRGRRCL